MSIYLYIFIMTISILFVVLAAVNACLKSHDKIFDAIEKVKQIKASDTNELSWKPSEEQMKSLLSAEGHLRRYECREIAKDIAKLYNDLKKL